MEKKKPCSRVVLVLLVIIVAIVTVAAVVPNSESKKPTEKVSPAVEKTNDPAPEELTQEPIADLNGLHVYFNGLEKAPAPAKGYYINLLLENTSDTNYTVQAYWRCFRSIWELYFFCRCFFRKEIEYAHLGCESRPTGNRRTHHFSRFKFCSAVG